MNYYLWLKTGDGGFILFLDYELRELSIMQ